MTTMREKKRNGLKVVSLFSGAGGIKNYSSYDEFMAKA